MRPVSRPIGAGRVDPGDLNSPNAVRSWIHDGRHGILFQVDGRESSLGVDTKANVAFVVSGKIDGSARDDAATQVMQGLLPGFLRPQAQNALVVGLGTGSTAGWAGVLPNMKRVDVVELEPAMKRVARLCAPVNRDVMNNPRVQFIAGDGREILLTSRDRYDFVISVPSNPYRAGVATLFTREFYRGAVSHLKPGGMFVQWFQAYEDLSDLSQPLQHHLAALDDYLDGNYPAALTEWRDYGGRPANSIDRLVLAEMLADRGDSTAAPLAEEIRRDEPIEADIVLGRLEYRRGNQLAASRALIRAFTAYRDDPWPMRPPLFRAVILASSVAEQDSNQARPLYEALRPPFSVYCADHRRQLSELEIATTLEGDDGGPLTMDALSQFEPDPPWDADDLLTRARCYARQKSPLARRALLDLREYRYHSPAAPPDSLP